MKKMDDEELTGDVIAALAAGTRVRATDIRVRTLQGAVRLEGIVDTLEEKAAAEETAAGVPGVRRVENDLAVSSNGTISDLQIERCVADRLVREGLAEVGARVEAGTAFLMGVIPSRAIENKALEVASGARGVRSVISELSIAAGKPVDDIRLAGDVAEALSDDPRIEAMDLEVASEDGAVTLTGLVTGDHQVSVATEIAEAVPGVQSVQNRLSVRKLVVRGM